MFIQLGYNVRCSQPRKRWVRTEKKIKLKSSVKYFIKVRKSATFKLLNINTGCKQPDTFTVFPQILPLGERTGKHLYLPSAQPHRGCKNFFKCKKHQRRDDQLENLKGYINITGQRVVGAVQEGLSGAIRVESSKKTCWIEEACLNRWLYQTSQLLTVFCN